MKRPFLEQPEAWTRASRTGVSRAEYADPVEPPPDAEFHPAELIMFALAAGVLMAFSWGLL
jgi:hypothetical protein